MGVPGVVILLALLTTLVTSTTGQASATVDSKSSQGPTTPHASSTPIPKSTAPAVTAKISQRLSTLRATPRSTRGSVTPQAAQSSSSGPTVLHSTPQPTHKSTTPLVTTPDPRANKSVCYQFVGCFDNFPPFNNANLDLPIDPTVLATGFFLFTRNNSDEDKFDALSYRNLATFDTSHFDPKLPVKVVLHGFSQNGNTTWVREMKNELLKNGAFNVLVVDWGRGATFPDYPQAVANTRLVAIEIRLLLEEMVRRGTNLDDVHLIGHSLGAHTAGYTGYLYKGKIGRITGMDPAEPDFEHLANLVRLDKGDAKFVDVMHTNGAPILLGGAGMMQVSGHVDFYVNGGESQPGCSIFKGILNGTDVAKAVSCSHGRSHKYFTESINSDCPFTSYPCSSYEDFKKGTCLSCGMGGCSQMGYYSDQYTARGKMFLNTRSTKPFCGFHYAISFFMPKGKDSRGKISVNLKGSWGETGFLDVTDSDDMTLKAGTAQSRLVVSPAEVGDVQSVVLRYHKYAGGWLFSTKGQDQIQGDRVEVTSGENGYKYLFCLQNTNLVHDQELAISVAHRSTC